MATTPALPPLSVSDLTQNMAGNGVFDVLMRNVSEHINSEMKKTRLTGNEFSALYLGGLQQVLNTSLEFLLRGRKELLEAELLKVQIKLAEVELTKAEAEVRLVEAQVMKAEAELPLIEKQVEKLDAEIIILEKQGEKIPAEIAILTQQRLNLQDELLTSALQRNQLTQQIQNLVSQKTMIDQQVLTEVENTKVMIAQECKLRAEFDVLGASKLKTEGETSLLAQKVQTERAQIDGSGVTGESVIGKQIALYTAQIKGFRLDAISKAAKELVATWNVRRTTDSGTQANSTNKLDDPNVGRVVEALISTAENF